ncbi:MAG: endonuclease III [Nitrososphaeria archaeon]|jgi:endonuclease-3
MKKSDGERKKRVLKIIIEKVNGGWKGWSSNPLETLVGTIISQNTNDRNTERAMELLRKEIGINLDAILSAPKEKIMECLKPAGLYNTKAPRIIELAKILKEKIGDPKKLEEMSSEDVRQFLSKIKGIGPKTVDVFLAFSRKEDVIPVDTHIKRVAKRLGFAAEKDNYFKIRENLEKFVPKGERVKAHFALITFGREICNARQPKCSTCPVMQYCPSKKIFYPDI